MALTFRRTPRGKGGDTFQVGAMATADQTNDTLISSKAFDLLSCFATGLDDVIRSVAETIARKRQGESRPILIETQDVEMAADLFLEAVRMQLGADPSKAEALQDIQEMWQCLKNKCTSSLADKK